MTHSVYQLALFDFIQNQAGSAIVDAKAGSGKTTSIVEACRRLPAGKKVLFLAFNVGIVKELKERLPTSITCCTFNSCGWGAWRRSTGKKVIQVDGRKTWSIVRDNFTEEDANLYGAFVNKMVALAKSSGLRCTDPDEDWYDVMDHHALVLDSEDAELGRAIFLSKKTLEKSVAMGKVLCDFDDQIYLPWLQNSTFDKYDVIFIDEAQDTNSVQKELLKRMLKPGGRLIAVGDPHQAIYGFRGAGSNSMEEVRIAFNATQLPLSISYRCSKAVIRKAQQYVPDIEAFEHAPEGEVRDLDDYNIGTFSDDDAIICRNNAPLIEMAYAFISRGRAINFLGRDIGGGLKSLIKNMKASNLENLSTKLGVWLEREANLLIEKGQEEKIDLLNDRVKCIEIFIQHLPEDRRTIDDLLLAIDNLFNSGDSGITLTSAHKSKGREWNNVFILDFHLMPSSYAKKKAWMMDQENNLIYVAITRAKLVLSFISSKCWTDEPELKFAPKPAGESVSVKAPRKSGGKMKTFKLSGK